MRLGSKEEPSLTECLNLRTHEWAIEAASGYWDLNYIFSYVFLSKKVNGYLKGLLLKGPLSTIHRNVKRKTTIPNSVLIYIPRHPCRHASL